MEHGSEEMKAALKSLELRKKNLERQQIIEKNAVVAVEELLNKNITREGLQNAGNIISPSHYKDATEERAIEKLCGYPLCNNRLSKISMQKYRIQASSNKVFDVSERKNFCSGNCYAASQFFASQIPKEPLWVREKQDPVVFDIRDPLSMKGRSGELVFQNPKEILRQDIEELERTSHDNGPTETTISGLANEVADLLLIDKLESDEELQPTDHKTTTTDTGRMKEPNIESDLSISSQMKDSKTFRNTVIEKNHTSGSNEDAKSEKLFKMIKKKEHLQNTQNHTQLNPNIEADTVSKKVRVTAASDSDSDDYEENDTQDEGETYSRPTIANIVVEDFSLNLHQPSKSVIKQNPEVIQKHIGFNAQRNQGTVFEFVKSVLLDWRTEATLEYLQGSGKHHKLIDKHEFDVKYNDLGNAVDKKIALEHLKDLSDTGTKQKKQQCPDFKSLKESSVEFNAKVQAFYKGSHKYEVPILENASLVHEKEPESEPVLPPIDRHSQNLLRRRIVLDKLNHVLSELLGALRLSVSQIAQEVNELIVTFRFDSHNIVLKPAEWTVMGLLLLFVLSERVTILKEVMITDVGKKTIDRLLQTVAVTRTDVESLQKCLLSTNL